MPANHRNENEGKPKTRPISEPCQWAGKAMEYEGNCDINYNWCPWNSPQELGKEIGWTGGSKKNWNHPDYSTIKIS